MGLTSSSSGFSDSAFAFASEWVQRKLFEENKATFGIVLIGTERHNNPQGYENITIADCNDNDGFIAPATFETLRYLEKHIAAEKSEENSNWIQGVEVAAEYLKNHRNHDPDAGVLKIAMISDLGCPIEDPTAFDEVYEDLTQNEIQLVFIGPDWEETRDPSEEANPFDKTDDDVDENGHSSKSSTNTNPDKKPMTEEQKSNFELVKVMIESTDGSYVDIKSAILYFTEKERKKKKPTPWKCDLEIGPDILVNVTGYVKVRKESPKAFKRCIAGDPNCEEITPDVTYVRNNEEQEPIDREDCVEAYKYGSDLITVSGKILIQCSISFCINLIAFMRDLISHQFK